MEEKRELMFDGLGKSPKRPGGEALRALLWLKEGSCLSPLLLMSRELGQKMMGSRSPSQMMWVI